MLPLAGIFSALSGADWVDIGCAVAALTSIGLGSRRGLSSELPVGVGWFCAVLAAWYAYAPVHNLYKGLSIMEGQPEFLFVATLVTVVLLAWGVELLVSRGLRLLAAHVEKQPMDYVLGTVVGVIRAFLLILIVTAIMLAQPWWSRGRVVFCDESHVGKVFAPWASSLLVTLRKLKPDIEVPRRRDEAGDVGAGFGSVPPPNTPPKK
jgi:hypothetical protein